MKRIILILILISILSNSFIITAVAEGEQIITKTLTETTVAEDIDNLTNLEGSTFDINDYPAVEGADPELMTVVEDCKLPKSYTLYVYIYNPGKLNIELSNGRIQIAFEDNVNYFKYDMKYISDNELIYKYRVQPSETEYKMLSASTRKIKISGFELSYQDRPTKFYEYEAGKNFIGVGRSVRAVELTYEGNNPSSMTKAVGIDALTLNVDLSYYRTTSGKDSNLNNQLMTAYFIVPNEYFERYGSIRKMHYQYKKKERVPFFISNFPIDISSGEMAFLQGDLGVQSGLIPNAFLIDRGVRLTYNLPTKDIRDIVDISNITNGSKLRYSLLDADNALYYETPGIDLSDTTASDLIHGSMWKSPYDKQYMNMYAYKFNDSDLKISTEECNEYFINRQMLIYGSETYEKQVDAEDPNDFLSVESYIDETNIFQRISDYGLSAIWMTFNDDSYEDILPIEIVDSNDYTLTDSEFSLKYKIECSDCYSLKRRLQNANNSNGKLVLLRFDIGEYESYDAKIWADICDDAIWPNKSSNGKWEWRELKSIRGNENDRFLFTYNDIYTDFDLIDMTWQQNQEQLIIPIIANPIEIYVAPIVPPEEIIPEMIPREKSPEVDYIALIIILASVVFILIFGKPIAIFSGKALGYPIDYIKTKKKNREKSKRRRK